LFSWWREQREWCCPTFRGLHDARYGRGPFVFVRPPGWASVPGPSFWLAFRSVRQRDLPRLPARGLPPDVPVTVSTYERIFYCPGCGSELDKFYAGGRWEKLFDPAITQEFELPTRNAGSAGPSAAPDGAGRDGS
jgi:hypothetical protein